MLIITRRTGERIMVGDDVVVHVLDVGGGSVRIGIEAPRDVTVLREELLDGAGAQVDRAPGTVKA